MNKPLASQYIDKSQNISYIKRETLNQYSRKTVFFATIAFDLFAIVSIISATWLAYVYFYLGFKENPLGFFKTSLIMGFVTIFIGVLRKDYLFHYFLKTRGHGQRLFACWNIAFITLLAVSFIFKSSEELSRGHILLTYALGFPLLWMMRLKWVDSLRMWSKMGLIEQNKIIIIGKNDDVKRFISQFQPWNHGLLLCETFILDVKSIYETQEAYIARMKVAVREITNKARQMNLSDVFVALPWQERTLIETLVDEVSNLPVIVHLTPEGIIEKFSDLSVTQLGDVSALALARPPLTKNEIYLKRAFDLTVACSSLIFVLPLLALVALCIWFDSKGAILYKQQRMGFNQNKFFIYKFRTMFVMESNHTVKQATRNDPRITRIGRFLRKWNIDELPQIFNVIKGEMSLVGPRPNLLVHDIEFSERLTNYARRYHFRPGMTGWSQINGYRGEFTAKNTINKRLEHDIWYMNNWTVGMDLLIMLRTVTSKKAYENAF